MAVAKIPEGPPATLDEHREALRSGIVVGTNDAGGVGIACLVDGDLVWRADWDPDEAEAIGKELVRLARQRRRERAS